MRKFIDKEHTGWTYGEKEVIEVGTDKKFTLTQPKVLFKEDSYHIKRSIAVAHESDNRGVQEDGFYAYEIAYMPDGYSLSIVTVDEQTAEKLISGNLLGFMHGTSREYIKNFFETEEK